MKTFGTTSIAVLLACTVACGSSGDDAAGGAGGGVVDGGVGAGGSAGGSGGALPDADSDAGPSSIEGDFSHGSLCTVRGTGFGDHPDFHPDADKLIRMWETFETGDFTSNAYGSWSLFNPDAIELMEQSPTARNAAGDSFLYRRNETSLGNLEFPSQDHEAYYFAHWIRLSDDFDVCGSNGTQQWKGTRLSSGNNQVNVYWAYGCADGFNIAIEYTSPQILRWQAQIAPLPEPPARLEGWHRWDMYVRKSTSADSNDGELQIFVDNERVYDFLTDTGVPHHGGMGFDSEGGDFATRVAIGSYFSSASVGTWLDYDDLYISHTLARVELCDGPTFETSRHCELQEPIPWTDTAVEFRVNRGTFPVDDDAWLFVVDESGAPSTAYAVRVLPD